MHSMHSTSDMHERLTKLAGIKSRNIVVGAVVIDAVPTPAPTDASTCNALVVPESPSLRIIPTELLPYVMETLYG